MLKLGDHIVIVRGLFVQEQLYRLLLIKQTGGSEFSELGVVHPALL
jgi:hypothetical protein